MAPKQENPTSLEVGPAFVDEVEWLLPTTLTTSRREEFLQLSSVWLTPAGIGELRLFLGSLKVWAILDPD